MEYTKGFQCADCENYYLSEYFDCTDNSDEDSDENYFIYNNAYQYDEYCYDNGMDYYYENNHDPLDEADEATDSDDSCYEDDSDASGDSDSYCGMDFDYEKNYNNILLKTNPYFEEYNDSTDDSEFYNYSVDDSDFYNDDSVDDSESYDEESYDTDEDSDSCFVDDFDSADALNKHDLYENLELFYRSNLYVLKVITSNEYSVLLLFYERLLEDLRQKFFVSSFDMKSSIGLLIDCYSLVNCGQLPIEIDFNSMKYCLGYLYRYGACHTALVLEAISTMLESSSVLLPLLNKKKLNVMFLGGGPGYGFFGFLIALHEHHNLLHIDATIVDKMSGWEIIFMETVKRLQRGDFDQACPVFQNVNVTPSFISANLNEIGAYFGKMEIKMIETDLVFLVKTLSHIPDAEKLDVLQNIVFFLKPGALLVYIDFPFPHKTFASLRCLRLVYESSKIWYSTSSDSSSEYSDVCLEDYTSSLECTDDGSCNSGSGTEIEDDKQVIFNFYKTLSVELLQTFSIESWEVYYSVQNILRNYRYVRDGTLPTEIDYTKKSNCIGYLHRYAACHTALVFDAVTDIFNSSFSDVLSPKLNKKSLNVMFLGGGPGNDFVGFLTALHDHHRHLFDLNVSIVDKDSGWEDIFNETMEILRQGQGGKAGSFFDEVNVITTFITADLKNAEEWDESLQIKLQNADIVFFVKVLSHIPDDDKPQVLQDVDLVKCGGQSSSGGQPP
ncbi:hypothetical protein HNY73_012786 [Argiope bruennichi]|uniref:Uncharacterized protein n=1 Tax=Argiope bruennichi TaxID=94029 RepID=A0A8T0EXV4_ARGBR|nr:hypothetical protein HNY73_012786 [Argiope bruennichi]